MNNDYKKIFPLGDNALTISFGNKICPQLNDLVIKLARNIENNPFCGFIETVPAYASLTIFYDILITRKTFPQFSTAFEAVENFVEKVLLDMQVPSKIEERLIKIPVLFDKEFALDLAFVASANKLKPEEVIKIFTARTYRVYMLGFLPGFAYMGEVDTRIATPRKSSPRLEVPKGSVGIAGGQTGIYSLESPGGWQIIGKTTVEMFTPEAATPTFFQAGDLVQFYTS